MPEHLGNSSPPRLYWSSLWRRVDEMQFEVFRAKLLKVIDLKLDSLRFYKLMGGRDRAVEAYGIDKYVDFNEPLIL